MSDDDPLITNSSSNASQNVQPPARQPSKESRGLFSIPPPVKRIFDRFPLLTYDENELPLRARTLRGENVLHIFATKEDARNGRPSFNPACLKWQTYLKLAGISFATVASSNHASPSGMLPFLLPAKSSAEPSKTVDPIAVNKLRKWAASQDEWSGVPQSVDIRVDAYTTLLDNSIREAWLYQHYLSPTNANIVRRLYVEPCSSNPFVQWTIHYQLRRAAESELVKASASSTISEDDIMNKAEEAFEALSMLLGQGSWFFGEKQPTLFDASVFAYTYLLLNENMGWKENRLGRQVEKWENLLNHRHSMLDVSFG